MDTFDEKTRAKKSRATVPLKVAILTRPLGSLFLCVVALLGCVQAQSRLPVPARAAYRGLVRDNVSIDKKERKKESLSCPPRPQLEKLVPQILLTSMVAIGLR
jgi:hypothetical protein